MDDSSYVAQLKQQKSKRKGGITSVSYTHLTLPTILRV